MKNTLYVAGMLTLCAVIDYGVLRYTISHVSGWNQYLFGAVLIVQVCVTVLVTLRVYKGEFRWVFAVMAGVVAAATPFVVGILCFPLD